MPLRLQPGVIFNDCFRLHGDTPRGDRLGATKRNFEAHIRQVGGELEIEAAATAPHLELGMTYSPLGMIRPRSELFIKGRLLPAPDTAA